ncbi:MAG: hypothetical protein DCC68_25730 [Planctomycetota bacterium]|nr:MAG: hypothetical protein DCC68_25730 [Planctomycetota bacterium]
MDEAFMATMKRHVAHLSVGASTVRGQRTKGLVGAARSALCAVDLARFAVKQRNIFDRRLDDATEVVSRRLPQSARSWGLSRKITNIFLRLALYNRFLCEHYDLHRAEAFYEVALDSIVAKCIKRRSEGYPLPTWPGVKHLTADVSKVFQQRASEIADEKGIFRVHLDMIFWTERE